MTILDANGNPVTTLYVLETIIWLVAGTLFLCVAYISHDAIALVPLKWLDRVVYISCLTICFVGLFLVATTALTAWCGVVVW